MDPSGDFRELDLIMCFLNSDERKRSAGKDRMQGGKSRPSALRKEQAQKRHSKESESATRGPAGATTGRDFKTKQTPKWALRTRARAQPVNYDVMTSRL